MNHLLKWSTDARVSCFHRCGLSRLTAMAILLVDVFRVEPAAILLNHLRRANHHRVVGAPHAKCYTYHTNSTRFRH